MAKMLVVEVDERMTEGIEMREEPRLGGPQSEISLPEWFGKRHPSRVRTVWSTLLRISCWSAVAWLVWNHVLSNYLNAGGIGFLISVLLGSLLHVMSVIFGEP